MTELDRAFEPRSTGGFSPDRERRTRRWTTAIVMVMSFSAGLVPGLSLGADQQQVYSVGRDEDRIVVSLEGHPPRTFVARYERQLDFGTSFLAAEIRDRTSERAVVFSYREAEGTMELVVDEQSQLIEVQSGIVRIGEHECDGSNHDWLCVAQAIAPQVRDVPTEMLLAVFELIREDLAGPDTMFGSAVVATFEILIRDRLESSPPAAEVAAGVER